MKLSSLSYCLEFLKKNCGREKGAIWDGILKCTVLFIVLESQNFLTQGHEDI